VGGLPHGIVTRTADICEFQAEEPACLIFGDLSGDAEWATREIAIPSGEFLG
jgi:hypothetical protein